jgi:hypothetical protein
LVWDPYQFVYETAKRQISEFAVKLGQNSGEIGKIFDVWPFAPIDEVPFLQDLAPLEPLDSIWQSGHRYKEWAEFAELALRLVSCVTSESAAERVLSMAKNIAGLHRPRVAIGTMEARLRAQIAGFSPVRTAHDDHENAEGSDGDQISDEQSSDIGEDSDSEST